eukprot:11202325-Lingulodinium_polyedra.AAC.1
MGGNEFVWYVFIVPRAARCHSFVFGVNAIGPDALVFAAASLRFLTERRCLVGVSEGLPSGTLIIRGDGPVPK